MSIDDTYIITRPVDQSAQACGETNIRVSSIPECPEIVDPALPILGSCECELGGMSVRPDTDHHRKRGDLR